MEHAVHRERHPVHEELGGYEGSKLAMWLFLATELLLFGVLFAGFAIFHSLYLESFKAAHHSLDKIMGGVNTVVLIVSSMFVALSLDAIQRGKRKLSSAFLIGTIVLAGVFLVVKYFEYTSKFENHIFPGGETTTRMIYDIPEGTALYTEGADVDRRLYIVDPRNDNHEYIAREQYIAEMTAAEGWSEQRALEFSRGIDLFFTYYFTMTGIHGLHVVIGMTCLLILFLKNQRGRYSHWYYTPVENGALYWHLVDLIWIYLFPLFYLVS